MELRKPEAATSQLNLPKSRLKAKKAGKTHRQGYHPAPDKGDKIALTTSAGAAAGAAVGTFAGMLAGFKELQKDQISLQQQSHLIRDPKLVGYYHSVQQHGSWEDDEYVHKGHWHRFSPDLDYKTVGEYQTPEYQHSLNFHSLTGGLLGLAAGALAGGILGAVIGLINHAIQKGKGGR